MWSAFKEFFVWLYLTIVFAAIVVAAVVVVIFLVVLGIFQGIIKYFFGTTYNRESTDRWVISATGTGVNIDHPIFRGMTNHQLGEMLAGRRRRNTMRGVKIDWQKEGF